MTHLCRRNAAIAGKKETVGADASPKGGSTMSEVLPFPPKPPPKSIEEETAEFLALLQRIRSQSESQSQKSK